MQVLYALCMKLLLHAASYAISQEIQSAAKEQA